MIRIRQKIRELESAIETENAGLISNNPKNDQALESSLTFFYSRCCSEEMGQNELSARLNGAYISGGKLVLNSRPVVDERFREIPARNEQIAFAELIERSPVKDPITIFTSRFKLSKIAVDTINLEGEGLEYFLRALSNREMGAIELSTRLNGGYISGGKLTLNSRPAVDEQFREILTNSLSIRLGEAVEKSGFKDLLIADCTSLTNSKKLCSQTTIEVEALEYFLGALSKETMSYRELFTRLDGGYISGGRLTINSRAVLDEQYREIPATNSQIQYGDKIGVIPDLKSALLKLGDCICQKRYGPAIANAVAACLLNNGAEQVQQLFLAEGKASEARPILEAVTTLKEALRQRKFQVAYLNSLNNTSVSLTDLEKQIDQYQLISERDQQIRTQSISLSACRRRLELASMAIGDILKNGSFESVNAILRPLAQSKDPKDLKYNQLVIEFFCRREIAFKNLEACKLVAPDMKAEAVRDFISKCPLRSDVGEIGYKPFYQNVEAFLTSQLEFARKLQRLAAINRIRQSCQKGNYETLKAQIESLDFGLPDDLAAKRQVYKDVRATASINSPEEYDRLFKAELDLKARFQALAEFDMPDLGKNRPATNYLNSRFRIVFNPLLQTLRKDPESADGINLILGKDPVTIDGTTIRRGYKIPYEIDVARLEAQRGLTDIERTYLSSVEKLSKLNPALVAMMKTSPDEVLEYLYAYFQRQTETTWNSLKDGDYIPIVALGLGAHGIAAMGEAARLNPDLMHNILIVDQENLPGGPFSVPSGPAWELNSANLRGDLELKMPNPPEPDIKETDTVRAYGSPTRWLPGERSELRPDTRGGSINQLVDFLPSPDAISDYRYPTNEEMAIVAQMQAALIAEKACLRTELVGFKKNTDRSIPGDKILTLEHTFSDGKKERKTIYTDGFPASAGLGEGNYGFKLEGSRAASVIKEKTRAGFFPKISRTLEAFRALANKRGPKLTSLGDTIVLYGNGNSTDTILEKLGGLFQRSNPLVKNVTKIIVIAEGDPSARPRYAKIQDLFERCGRGNLVEVIRNRVSDIGPSLQNPEQLLVYGRDGTPIKDAEGQLVQCDHCISGAGFNPKIKQLITGKNDLSEAQKAFVPFALPTNPDIFVGEILADDPNTFLQGTAAKPFFDSRKKITLPPSSSGALSRVGGENAVAIGFRVPETQAAMRIWITAREFELAAKTTPTKTPLEIFENSGFRSFTVKINPDFDATLSRSIKYPQRLSSAILGALLKEENVFLSLEGKRGASTLKFEVALDNSGKSLIVRFNGPEEQYLSAPLAKLLERVISDSFLSGYLVRTIKQKRGEPKAQINITISNGEVNLARTFVE